MLAVTSPPGDATAAVAAADLEGTVEAAEMASEAAASSSGAERRAIMSNSCGSGDGRLSPEASRSDSGEDAPLGEPWGCEELMGESARAVTSAGRGRREAKGSKVSWGTREKMRFCTAK